MKKKVVQSFILSVAKRKSVNYFVKDYNTFASYNYENGGRIIRYYLPTINKYCKNSDDFLSLFIVCNIHEFVHYIVPQMKEGKLLKKIEVWFKGSNVVRIN